MLKKFGKKMGFDYDKPKTYVNYDDWDSNADAYVAFSLGWFLFLPVMLLIGSYLLLVFIAKKLLK
jgi:hypothetical protein